MFKREIWDKFTEFTFVTENTKVFTEAAVQRCS